MKMAIKSEGKSLKKNMKINFGNDKNSLTFAVPF